MASQTELNPIYLNSNSIRLLTQAAVSDAKHDFGTDFINIFTGGRAFKQIGTTLIPSDIATPSNEHATLHNFMSPGGQTIIHVGNPAHKSSSTI